MAYMPLVEICKDTRGPDCGPLLSVIIPTSGRQSIHQVLAALEKQSVSAEKFEVIIVNDGSDIDLSSCQIRNLLLLKVHKTENSFRAAFNRNIGAFQARADRLCFLDDDIFVPSHYLESVSQYLRAHCILMSQRKETFDKVSNFSFYWKQFYQQGKKWNELKNPWKYVCSHSLSILKEDFVKLGQFNEQFDCYGYEDVELGWRAYRQGFQFELLDVETWHLSKQSFFFKKRLSMHAAAKIFVQLSQSPDVYDHCRVYLQNFSRIRLIKNEILYFINNLTLKPLKRIISLNDRTES